jgi:iron complex outermembrane receptor protein
MRWTRIALVLACLTFGGRIAPAQDDAGKDEARDSGLTETVTVSTTRLPGESGDVDRLPASVTLLTAEQIAKSGAETLGELLALEAGAVFYDQTGNGVQTIFDLRGFTRGSGVRVYLDGAPLNDGLNNALALDLVPLGSLAHVEITRGSAAALAGGGAEAGVIHLVTRRGEELAGTVGVEAGSYDASAFSAELSHDAGVVDFLLSGRLGTTDGFRDNAGGDLDRLSAGVGFDLGHERRLALTLVDSASEFGTPGALTAEEIAADPSATPYNRLDYADERLGLASLNFHGPVGRALTLSANAFGRDRETDSLTTGRAAPTFGGFAFESAGTFLGSTVQLTHRLEAGDGESLLTVGGEWLDGDTRARGFFTPASDPGAIPAAPDTNTLSDRRTAALYVQEAWTPGPSWSITAGARYDQDRVALDETLPDPGNDRSRRFSELSLRGGATWSPDGRHALHAAYGEGFLPPTSEELFAFPGFGSNPDLDPEDSRSYELGFRRQWDAGLRLDAALFRIDTEDEIVFDPDSPLGPFGANVNAGETRRQGLELSLRGPAASRTELFVNVTLTDAEFTAGDFDGNDVPLVPRERLAAGVDLRLPAGVSLRVDGLRVGAQVLDNDDANAQPELPAYTVVGTRARFSLAELRGRSGGLSLHAGVENLFDEQYATRGIWAFDFSSGMDDAFFTPAPGRRWTAGAEWTF